MKRVGQRNVRLSVITLALVAGLSAGYAARALTADKTKVVMDGSSTVLPLAEAFRDHYIEQHPNVEISIGGSGSGNGVKSLIRGTCHIANMSRFMKPTEFKAAVENNVLPVAHVIAIDGIAIVVHPSNPIGELTLDQIRDIYAGRINSWKDVGGPSREIVTISRDQNSGTFESFRNLVMRDAQIAGGAEKVGSNGAVRSRVQTTPAAIGYVGIGYVDRKLKAVKVDGVEPTRKAIASGRYPIARPLFMFTNGYPELGSHLHALTTVHLTREGQEIVEEVGFVPVTDYESR